MIKYWTILLLVLVISCEPEKDYTYTVITVDFLNEDKTDYIQTKSRADSVEYISPKEVIIWRDGSSSHCVGDMVKIIAK